MKQKDKTTQREFALGLNNPESNDKDIISFISLYEKIQKRYGKDAQQILNQLSKDVLIPISAFTTELSCLETISKFLKENRSKEFNEIAALAGRSNKTIWQAYKFAIKKYPHKLAEDYSQYNIPVSIFKARQISLLETLVVYLKDRFDLRFSEIAKLIHRNQRTIWTVYSRATKKKGRSKRE